MTCTPDHEAATLVAVEIAVEALPPLTREVFLLHRVDELSYDDIARRLSIGVPAVEGGLADALYRLCRTFDGDTAERTIPEPLAHAMALLSRRYRRYCEVTLHALGIIGPVSWDNNYDDDDVVAMRVLLLSLPAAVRQTLSLSLREQLTYAQIAKRMGSSRWIVRWRMFRATRWVARAPATFTQWLQDI